MTGAYVWRDDPIRHLRDCARIVGIRNVDGGPLDDPEPILPLDDGEQ